MSNKIITFSDSKYFDYGQFFIKTRNKINADFILYGPDLKKNQIDILNKNKIEYRKVNKDLFEKRMQLLKFDFMRNECKKDNFDNGIISFIDFDTFFLKDWHNSIDKNFDIGITFNRSYIASKTKRAYANGGVIFCRKNKRFYNLISKLIKIIEFGGDESIKEYDEIYLTLENGRPKHKTHYRTNLRWWVDQVMLSSLVLKCMRKDKIKNGKVFDILESKILLLDCDKYNNMNFSDIKDIVKNKKSFIFHMKNAGRQNFSSINKIISKHY